MRKLSVRMVRRAHHERGNTKLCVETVRPELVEGCERMC